ncbi:MAG: helix-turn-helix domain-containing protein [Planctomycetes bacterium]|nr:helix-turn-helix domain-containing protein [Planctomycetota bacterium]
MKITALTPTTQALRELGQRLAGVRKQHGLTQEQLAATAGVGVATLRRIEDGKDGRLGSWVRLLTALQLDVALDQLLPEEIRSPLAEVKGSRARRSPPKPQPSGGEPGFVWGDQRG